MGKKILWYEENELGVNLCCSDNSIYSGDILVGADGVHSRVRHSLHKILAKKNMLSKSDSQPMKPAYVLVAGVTHRQSAERYQCLKDPFGHFCSVVGVQGRGWNVINIPDDQICWAMWVQLDSATAAQIEDTEKTEFGAKNTEPIVEWFRNMPCPYGGTMGDLVNSTSEDLKSKVYIEEKLFNTWYHGRAVLLGDGISTEIHDAVVLANCLFEIKDLNLKSITNAFKDYRRQRFSVTKSQYACSRNTAKLLCGQEGVTYRPQASFLAHAENRGMTPVVPKRPGKQWSEEEVAKRVTAVWEKGKASR
ncbi:hypothetical protein BGX26_005494 [Mortierella sp. AD094]|nr:hypothetical protein BGX26_005494 [Mortierella sp. AD094]